MSKENNLYLKEIISQAASYLPKEQIVNTYTLVEKYIENSISHFSQLKQEKDQITLEICILTKNYIFDIIISQEKLETFYFAISEVKFCEMKKALDSIMIKLGNGIINLNFNTVDDKKMKELESFYYKIIDSIGLSKEQDT